MRPRELAPLVVVALLAGCVGALQPSTSDPASALVADGARLAPGAAFLWEGKTLTGPRSLDPIVAITTCLALLDCPSANVECGDANCERREVEVAGETPFDGRLVVGVRWPSDHSVWLALWVEDASGALVARGRSITIDHLGASAVLDRPEPGRYHVVVAAAAGRSAYEAAAQLVPRAGDEGVRELLPDLVTLPPTDLRIADPPAFGPQLVPIPLLVPLHPTGGKGCGPDEEAASARKCLRFSNAVGNLGEGPLEVALSLVDGATHAAGGRFVQRIAMSDGTWREQAAGPAEFHAYHGHWHNAAANAFTVYAYDDATKLRGEALAEGRKTGICLADVGIVDPAWSGLDLPAHQGAQCFNPSGAREWSMGIAPGWYDLYPWILADQYVDLAGVADGSYLLCSTTNAAGTLVESDTTNDEACTAFRLAGDLVETLDAPPYHAEPSG